MNLDNKVLLGLYEKMLLIRQLEYKIYDFAKKGIVFGSVHLCVGEEASAVGTCMNLTKDDFILPTHRGHGQAITKGADLKRFLAEIIGKNSGLCKGRVGSMHTFDKENNNLGAQGILGAQFPIAVGVGLAIKLKNLNSIVACFFGDGTSNQGTFYEALNFADLWDLPIFFVCINNLYGMGTHYCNTSKVDIFKKGKIFNIVSTTADGNDVEEVYVKAKELINEMKKKKRPALLECSTYRWFGHSAFDNRPYRLKKEVEEWKTKDPIKRLENKLSQNTILSKEIEKIKITVTKKINEAADFAINSKYPEFDVSVEM
ncbi:MAG: thiamine pyrophosphate-dependent dehydrogenase E1 component subunit alpha [Actinobacteria bacterium]|nr:thiamine pyrophosphate-dependent dehydrogenase E1 component subunit alpha [Actinomycetota bacterium]